MALLGNSANQGDSKLINQKHYCIKPKLLSNVLTIQNVRMNKRGQ